MLKIMESNNKIRTLEEKKNYKLWKACLKAYLIEKNLDMPLINQRQKFADTESEQQEKVLTSAEKKHNAKIIGIIINSITPEIFERIEGVEVAFQVLDILDNWFTIDRKQQKRALKKLLHNPTGANWCEKLECFRTTLIKLKAFNYVIDEDDKIDMLLNIVKHRQIETFQVILKASNKELNFDSVYSQLYNLSSEIDAIVAEAREKAKLKPNKASKNKWSKQRVKSNKFCKQCKKHGHTDQDEHCNYCKKYGHKSEKCYRKGKANVAECNRSCTEKKDLTKLKYIEDEQDYEEEDSDYEEEASNIAIKIKKAEKQNKNKNTKNQEK
eukprot:augustus_masked-scaffold_7-processed-gene-16.50-mRNA-1 protein AED:1.00 eAED:1.00 QI:0/-1/0/0/-1/1/1/0/325